jgi:hypothetical protein
MIRHQGRVASGTSATIRPPPWADADAVVDWVLFLWETGSAELPNDDLCRVLDDPDLTREQQAVEAAKRGDLRPLTDLFEAAARAGNSDQDHPESISPSTLQLAAEFLNGKRNLKTGRDKSAKEQRGRPKISKEERTAKTPSHWAAKYYLPAVERILRTEYPRRRAEHYRDRAIYIVSIITGVKEKTLRNYLNRPRGAPQRI